MAIEIDLSKLTVAEKDALILSLLPLAGQLEAALARIAELEARLALLEKPAKTPGNSSLPPSKGQKANQPPDGRKPPRKSRPGFGRTLHPDPDRVVDRLLDACPHCATAWPAAPQTPQQVYDRIELPPVKPDVTRVRLFGGRCACCGERATAAAPSGLDPGSPFGKSVEAVVIYLHYAQAIGIERLRLVSGELFGLWVSEGALCNILARAQAPLKAAAAAIAAQVTASDVVASDETSVRVMKKTCWEWVFVTAAYVLHIIRPSRGAGVVRALFGAMRPQVWISDSLGSQRGHADRWQACLAHLLRDAQYAIDCGDGGLSAAFRRLLLRAIAIGRRRGGLRDSTLAQYRADLDRRLDHVLGLPGEGEAAERLRRRIARDREHLFVFVTDRRVPPTNNISERALRPSVIFRKVTNGFRSEWGANTYAAFRSVVSTAKVNGRSVLSDLRNAVNQQHRRATGVSNYPASRAKPGHGKGPAWEPWCLAASDLWTSQRRSWSTIMPGAGPSNQASTTPRICASTWSYPAAQTGELTRRDRLLPVSALSVALLTLLGTVGESPGVDRLLKSNTSNTLTQLAIPPRLHVLCVDPKHASVPARTSHYHFGKASHKLTFSTTRSQSQNDRMDKNTELTGTWWLD